MKMKMEYPKNDLRLGDPLRGHAAPQFALGDLVSYEYYDVEKDDEFEAYAAIISFEDQTEICPDTGEPFGGIVYGVIGTQGQEEVDSTIDDLTLVSRARTK